MSLNINVRRWNTYVAIRFAGIKNNSINPSIIYKKFGKLKRKFCEKPILSKPVGKLNLNMPDIYFICYGAKTMIFFLTINL